MTERDAKMFKALFHVLDSGRFNFTGKEALAFFEVYNWVKELEKKNNKPAKIKKESIRGNKSK